MPQYKYKKKVVEGNFGTIIGHKSSEENKVYSLGDIGEYTYIYADELGEQPDELVFEQIVLSKSELEFLKNNDVYINALEATTEAMVKSLVKDYPSFEIETFSTQEMEAKAYQIDNNASTPFIDNLCSSRGIEKDVMIEKILSNANTLKEVTAPIIGMYQKIINAI